MKKIFITALFLYTAAFCFAATIKVGATSNGLWCDLIRLRAQVKNETGTALPYSAYAECKVMGFFQDSASLVSHVTDTLSYDTETRMLTFTGKAGVVVCNVTTNTIQSPISTPTYVVFPKVQICCMCDQKVTSPHHVVSQMNDLNLDSLLTAAQADVDSMLLDDSIVSSFQNDKHEIVCPNADSLKNGKVLADGALHIEQKLAAIKDTNNMVGYRNWERALPLLEVSCVDTNCSPYNEIIRYLVCGGPLGVLDIEEVGNEDSLLISNYSIWPDQEIWVFPKAYRVAYIFSDTTSTDGSTMAVYDMRIAEKSSRINHALFMMGIRDTIPLCHLMTIDSDNVEIKRPHRIVSVRTEPDFTKTCTVYKGNGKPLFKMTWNGRSSKLSVDDPKKSKVIFWGTSTKLTRKNTRKMKKLDKILACFK